jgi:hypothetical protein
VGCSRSENLRDVSPEHCHPRHSEGQTDRKFTKSELGAGLETPEILEVEDRLRKTGRSCDVIRALHFL